MTSEFLLRTLRRYDTLLPRPPLPAEQALQLDAVREIVAALIGDCSPSVRGPWMTWVEATGAARSALMNAEEGLDTPDACWHALAALQEPPPSGVSGEELVDACRKRLPSVRDLANTSFGLRDQRGDSSHIAPGNAHKFLRSALGLWSGMLVECKRLKRTTSNSTRMYCLHFTAGLRGGDHPEEAEAAGLSAEGEALAAAEYGGSDGASSAPPAVAPPDHHSPVQLEQQQQQQLPVPAAVAWSEAAPTSVLQLGAAAAAPAAHCAPHGRFFASSSSSSSEEEAAQDEVLVPVRAPPLPSLARPLFTASPSPAPLCCCRTPPAPGTAWPCGARSGAAAVTAAGVRGLWCAAADTSSRRQACRRATTRASCASSSTDTRLATTHGSSSPVMSPRTTATTVASLSSQSAPSSAGQRRRAHSCTRV